MAFNLQGMLGSSTAGIGHSIVSQLVAANPTSKEMNINIEDIFPDPENHQVYSIEDIEELARNIMAVGLLHNIVVAPQDGKYMIISGERRWTAHRLLVDWGHEEFKTIRAMVSYEENENIRKLQWITANSTARKLTDAEMQKQTMITWDILNKLKEDGSIKGNIRNQLSEMLNISKTQLARYKKIENNMVPELKEQFDNNKLPISTAEKASELDSNQQKELAERLQGGGHVSLNEVTEMTKQEPEQDVQTPPPNETRLMSDDDYDEFYGQESAAAPEQEPVQDSTQDNIQDEPISPLLAKKKVEKMADIAFELKIYCEDMIRNYHCLECLFNREGECIIEKPYKDWEI